MFPILQSPLRFFFFFQAEDGIRDATVTGVQTCALPIVRGNEAGDGRDDTDAIGASDGEHESTHDNSLWERGSCAAWRHAAVARLVLSAVRHALGAAPGGPRRHSRAASGDVEARPS